MKIMHEHLQTYKSSRSFSILVDRFTGAVHKNEILDNDFFLFNRTVRDFSGEPFPVLETVRVENYMHVPGSVHFLFVELKIGYSSR